MKPTSECIAEDIADIENIRALIAEEIGASKDSKAVQAGVEAYAKARVEDLSDILSRYEGETAYQSVQDMLSARISVIRKRYGMAGKQSNTCPACAGLGYLPDACPKCDGEGVRK